MIIISLLYYYLGSFRNVFLISYLISFKSFFRRKITLLNMMLIFYIIFIFFLNFYRSSLTVSIFYIRLFWGVFFFYLYSARMVLFLAFLYRFYDEILKQKPNTSLLNKYNVIRWNIMSMRSLANFHFQQ